MNYKDTLENLDALFENGNFSLDRWKEYISDVFPELVDLCLKDAKDYDFEKDILPIVNQVYQNKQIVKIVRTSLCNLVNDLEQIIHKKFQKDVDVEIVLYVGLCNGAGWVTEINGKNVVLLGIEKIIDLIGVTRNT